MINKEEFTKKVSKKIQQIRNAKGMSQEDLAEKAGLYRTYVGHLENARYSPSAHVLYKLIKALGTDPKEFFSL